MNRSLKFVILLFACILSLSIGKDIYGEAAEKSVQELQSRSTRSYLNGREPGKAFGLYPTAEIVVHAANHFPAPVSKKHPDGSTGSLPSFEWSAWKGTAQSLPYTLAISWGLSVRDIIFPFHYFW